jgi:glycosyltransferase involved in cell wall biosynthesis
VKVLIVSGIWPPDVGGPATHAPQVAGYLAGRGHSVEVLTTADSAPRVEAYPVHTVSRSLPTPLRHARVSAEVVRLARKADVVYAASMVTRTAAGTAIARTPLVVKLSGDVAYERALRRGSYAGSLDEFQHASGGRLSLLRRTRTIALRRAEHVVCPSEFLRKLAVQWGVKPERVSVLPNPTPELPEFASRDELRKRYGVEGPMLAFAGRLTAAKSLDVALRALADVDGVSLLIAGDGEQRRELEERAHELRLDGRARFLGRQPLLGILELLHAADAAVLSSSWENFPHIVVEALAVGTPVIATAVGGVGEVVRDGENGLLVPARDPGALAAAVQRFFADAKLRERLRSAASSSVAAYGPERVFGEIERLLSKAAA